MKTSNKRFFVQYVKFIHVSLLMKYCNYIYENHEFRLSVFQQVLPHIEKIVNYENHYAYSFCHRIFATWIYLWFLSYTVLSLWFTFTKVQTWRLELWYMCKYNKYSFFLLLSNFFFKFIRNDLLRTTKSIFAKLDIS